MCRSASMIVGKNKIFIGSSDSHEDIKRENNLNDNFPINFVPIEIYPDDLDFSKNAKYWKLHTDLPKSDWPDWYSEEEAQEACRRKIKHWKNNLEKLYCDNTEIKEIPELNNLEVLYCSFSEIKKIPELNNLKELYCYNTKIKELPELNSLKELYCSSTKIKELPELKNLKELDCSNTKIKELPELPNLEFLNCENTEIKELPELKNLEILYCYNTNIKDFSGLSKNCEIYN